MVIEVDQEIPSGTFKSIPWTPELNSGLVCGTPGIIRTDDWRGKRVVVIGVPGAFTPTCHVNHLPPYLQRYDEFKAKGVDAIYVLAANDPYVMSGWGVSQKLEDKIITLSDTYAEWSEKMGLSSDQTNAGMGKRTARYVLILEDNKVRSIEIEPRGVPELKLTNAETTLSKL
ncbi:hypothetical protein FRC02_000144 [Tulasnella sp. 418]|nr:hypothetical protein FRC02_000144 [Tulasnella sp. 418]